MAGGSRQDKLDTRTSYIVQLERENKMLREFVDAVEREDVTFSDLDELVEKWKALMGEKDEE